jgi:hypothetical protein
MISLSESQSPMSGLKEEVYDQLVTRRIRQMLDRQMSLGLNSRLDALEENECPDYLARHLIRQVKSALRAISSEDRKRGQVELANPSWISPGHGNRLSKRRTSSIFLRKSSARSIVVPHPPAPPSTPVGSTSLLMNAVDEPRLGFELERELSTADRVLMVVSFVQWRGRRRLKAAFQDLAEREVLPGRRAHPGAGARNAGLPYPP